MVSYANEARVTKNGAFGEISVMVRTGDGTVTLQMTTPDGRDFKKRMPSEDAAKVAMNEAKDDPETFFREE